MTSKSNKMMTNKKDQHALLSSSPTSVSSIVVQPQARRSSSSSSINDNDDSVSPAPALVDAWEPLKPSQKSLRTRNPIRELVDPIAAASIRNNRNDKKDLISLALGDPTAAGNPHLPPCPVALDSIIETCSNNTAAGATGYANACGSNAARQAVANFHKNNTTTNAGAVDHVVIASGCSGALELALTALLDYDSILLVPEPGFPLYQVIAESHGAAVVHYRLLPDQQWQCDFAHLEQILARYSSRNNNNNNNIRGMVVNNPSNPTGAVYTKAHLQQIVQFCNQHRLPIIADEVYGDLTFAGHAFYPLAAIAMEQGQQVPVITASGIGKQFLLPGWRVGWVVFQDNVYGSLKEVEAGAKRLAQVILGASHLAQSVVPALLDANNNAVTEWKTNVRQTLERQAVFLCDKLKTIPGLQVVESGGAMYAMVRIRVDEFDSDIHNDLDFTKLLLSEENVFVLPGSCFGMANAFRVVFCAPILPTLQQAADRIGQFCARHHI